LLRAGPKTGDLSNWDSFSANAWNPHSVHRSDGALMFALVILIGLSSCAAMKLWKMPGATAERTV
jgi:hypothetical protein